MAMSINEELSKIGDVQGIVVVASSLKGGNAISELNGPDCRRMSLMYAARCGLASPGVNGYVEIYPVGEDCKRLEFDNVQQLKTAKVAGFQAAVPVTRKIV